MWFFYLLLFYLFILSFVLYEKSIKWTFIRCTHAYVISKNSLYLFAVFLFLLLFSTLRYPKEGTDTDNYFQLFDYINSPFYQIEFSFKPEYGYLLLNKAIGSIILNHQFFLLIINIFVLGSIFIFIKRYSKNIWISVLLFVFLGFFDSTMTLIRFNIALAITLHSYKYILQKNSVKFVFCIFVASLFHLTAWIFLIAYIIANLNMHFPSVKKYLIFLLTLCIFYFCINHFINLLFSGIIPYYDFYENNETFGIQDSTKIASVLEFSIIFTIVLFSFWIFYNKKKIDNVNIILIYLLMIACYFTMASFIFTPIGRIGKYFAIGGIVLIPNALEMIKGNNFRFILKMFVILFSLLRYTIIAYYRPEWYQIYPYKFFFE